MVWAVFLRCRLRYFGPHGIVLSAGGPEFRSDFERGLAQAGCFQHVCDVESPWQNGRGERHGGL
eukprot:13722460-Alexandrium_andersonii.AAC.1